MSKFIVTAEYETVGPDAREFGEPETRLEQALLARGIEPVGMDAGTFLATGTRDVEYEIEADSSVMFDALFDLPDSDRPLWKVEAL